MNVSINNFVLVTQAQRRRYRMDSDREGRELTNHSGKVTCCTTLFDDQFDDSIGRSRSGHTSDAVNVYKTENNAIEITTEGNTFQKYFGMAKACESKSVTIDLKSETMTINVD